MKRRGYTLIEMVLVMFLLILVSFFVFTATSMGSSAYLRLNAWQERTSDLRIGLSYIDVKVRSNDALGQMSIQPDPFTGADALVFSRVVDDQLYRTWIYVHEGYLFELFVPEKAVVSPEMGNRIARVDRLELKRSGSDLLTVTVSRKSGDTIQKRSRTIRMNSEVMTP